MEASPASPIKGKLKRKRGNDVEPTATAPETRAAQPSVNLSADVGDRNQTVPWPIFDSTERLELIVFHQSPSIFWPI